MPMAAASCGSRLVAVMPGIVFDLEGHWLARIGDEIHTRKTAAAQAQVRGARQSLDASGQRTGNLGPE